MIEESEEREIHRRLKNSVKNCNYDLQSKLEMKLGYIYRNWNPEVKIQVSRVYEL